MRANFSFQNKARMFAVGTDFQDSIFTKANVHGADFTSAHLESVEGLETAKGLGTAIFSGTYVTASQKDAIMVAKGGVGDEDSMFVVVRTPGEELFNAIRNSSTVADLFKSFDRD